MWYLMSSATAPIWVKNTDLYLSMTSRDTVPPNPYRR